MGPTASGDVGLLREDVVDALSDRMEGVALLAEALNTESVLGRYLEFLRMFESAFSRKVGSLGRYLAPFLTDASCPHGFTKREVLVWIEARPRAAHADRRPEILLEADVRPWIHRIEEAAYDVLLNKAEWRCPSPIRRDLWRPRAGSLDQNSGVFITKGREAVLSTQALDGFRAYPLMLARPVDRLLPRGVWLHGDVDGGDFMANHGGLPQRSPEPPPPSSSPSS